MKKRKIQLSKKAQLWTAGVVAGLLVVGAVGIKIGTSQIDPGVLGTTTVSVTVTCDGSVCTDLTDQVIDNSTGNPVLPDSNGEYNITDPNATINTTVKGAEQMIVTLTNSAYPAPTGVELFNQIFTSTDPAYGAIGDSFEILPLGDLAQYLQLGRNVFDFYVTSSVNPGQNIHRQLIINYTLPDKPGPDIIGSTLTDKDGNSLPFVSGSTDYVANDNDLPLHVELNANNINRVQLTVTDSEGNVGLIYDGAPLPPADGSGYATYVINGATGGMPGLKIGRNVITLTVTGLNGATETIQWVVYYWPTGVEPPNTGVIQIGNLTIAKSDLLVSIIIILAFLIIVFAVFWKRKNDRQNKSKKNQKSRKTKKPRRVQIKLV